MIEELVLNYSKALKSLGIEHKLFEHPHLTTTKEVQDFLGELVEDCVVSLVMKADDKFIVILKKGSNHLNFKKIKKNLKISNLRFATKEEFEKVAGLTFGTARVYIPNLDTYIDRSIFEKDYLNGGTGSFTCTFKYKTKDLKKIPNSTVIDVSDNPS